MRDWGYALLCVAAPAVWGAIAVRLFGSVKRRRRQQAIGGEPPPIDYSI